MEDALRRKLRASAYTAGGPDYRKLFRFLDLDNSGVIEKTEFIQLCRKSGKVSRGLASDAELMGVFRRNVDKDGNGSVSVDELIGWIESGANGETSRGRRGRHGAASSPAGSATGEAPKSVWPNTPDDPLYILQPPMHFANRASPQRVLREGGRKINDGTSSKLAAYLGSSAADQKAWEMRGMPASPSPVKRVERISSPTAQSRYN